MPKQYLFSCNAFLFDITCGLLAIIFVLAFILKPLRDKHLRS